MDVVSSGPKRKRAVRIVISIRKPASLIAWGCVGAHGMGNLHISEGTINAGRWFVLLVLRCLECWSKVIYARRKYSVSPPATTGHPDFDRVFRAQANCSEYFPLFVITLWMAGLFFSQALSAFLGLLYIYGRYQYFRGYAESAKGRLAPLYFAAKLQWGLVALSALGVFCCMCRLYLGVDLLGTLCEVLGLNQLE